MPDAAKKSLQAVIFDWAGTTVDHGSLAPVRTLQRVFAQRDIAVPDEVARRDMGLAKIDHIRKLLAEPEVLSIWKDLYGRNPREADVEDLYADFIPLQMSCLLDYSKLIDGVADTVKKLRARNIRIGGTTGYTRPMLEQLLTSAAAQGYRPDQSLCPDDVGAGRPHPYMCYRLAIDLRVYPMSACVKIGDTQSDIAEGLNAGMWTIGITRTGNMVGLSESDWLALPSAEQARILARAKALLQSSGAHYVAASVAECLPILYEIEGRIERGERP